MLRAIVDAQVWVRTVLFPQRRSASKRIREATLERRFGLIMSERLLAEVEEVLLRPRLMRDYEYSTVPVERLLGELRSHSALTSITGELKLCRDPKDDAVIETALAGGAERLVTDDRDLLASPVAEYLLTHGCRVVRTDEFVRELYPPALEAEEQ